MVCLIIGASHAGVNAAFALRKEGWEGKILLLDVDPHLPYHKPPLSKKYITAEDGLEKYALKPRSSYEKANIDLLLGRRAMAIMREEKAVRLDDGSQLEYDKLILAIGGTPFIPPIPGLNSEKNIFTLRNALDVGAILKALANCSDKSVAVIGGGFIGLEIAASLSQMGAKVRVFEREERVLARVSCPEISDWYLQFHREKGIDIQVGMELQAVEERDNVFLLNCANGSQFEAEMLVVGVGIRVNQKIASEAGLETSNGIHVNEFMQTSDKDIYAIGDCSWHQNMAYEGKMRLESVQNAVEQAKVAAAHICGKEKALNNIPWFWSDQFDSKLQMAGLSGNHDEVVIRKEKDSNAISAWFLKEGKLVAIHAVNNPRAYVIGSKFIKTAETLNGGTIQDAEVELKPANLIFPG